jgi:hypothetical protein
MGSIHCQALDSDHTCCASACPHYRVCNTFPCKVAYWSTTAWTSCQDPGDATKNLVVRTRNVTCQVVSPPGSPPMEGDASDCTSLGLTPPPGIDRCPKTDPCKGVDCGDNGRCIQGPCICQDGYAGSTCRFKSTCKGVIDGTVSLPSSHASHAAPASAVSALPEISSTMYSKYHV